MHYDLMDEEIFEEMATVATDIEHNIRIQVNPDRRRKGIPYFKVYDNSSYTSATKVARLHFKNYGIEDHKDRYESWYPNNKEIKMIRNFMMNQHVDFPQYTNWQMACWLWNLEYDFFNNHNRDEYFAGKFDEEYKDHPSYVSSNQEMPESWHKD